MIGQKAAQWSDLVKSQLKYLQYFLLHVSVYMSGRWFLIKIWLQCYQKQTYCTSKEGCGIVNVSIHIKPTWAHVAETLTNMLKLK